MWWWFPLRYRQTTPRLWKRISAADPRDRMPPLKSHKAQLTSAEREFLKTWILQGAKYESHWSFTTPARPEPPRTRDTRWGRNAIDAFVLLAGKTKRDTWILLHPSLVGCRCCLVAVCLAVSHWLRVCCLALLKELRS